MDKLTVKNFDEFQKLYQGVATLVRSLNYIDSEKRDYINSLLALARKMEVSNYIQQKNIIAIAGMQGAGKTSLIKTLYDLPQNILPIGSERGERNPIFITESMDLKPGEYKAKEVYFDFCEKLEREIDPEKIAARSKQKNDVAYIELFVPRRYFTCENAGFVLLPGFEKNSQREFNNNYNSIMDYTLHFANAVILTTDGSGIANEDIYVLVEKLGKNFNPSNCLFAITKSDTATEKEQQEMKESLLEVCADCGINITEKHVVSTGVYETTEENGKWIAELIDSISADGLLNYDAARRSFLYYRPMVDEMIACVDEIESELKIEQISEDIVGPIYDDLKVALQEREDALETELQAICSSAQQKAVKKFERISETIPSKHLRTKKLLIFNKKYHQIAEDKHVIAQKCQECLIDNNTNTSIFVAEAKAQIGSKENKNLLEEKIESALSVQEGQTVESMVYVNEYVRYHLDSRINTPPMVNGETPDIKAISEAISFAFYTTFCAMLTGSVNIETVGFKTTGVDAAINDVTNKKPKNNNMVPAMALLDMFDGKSDIAEAIAGLFAKGSAEAGAEAAASAASTILGVVAIAAILGIAAKTGIDIYNSKIEEQKLILDAWERALKNSISEQTNNCLDVFREGKQKLLEYVQKIHRKRNHIGEKQMRIISAQYAIADIRNLLNSVNDEYANSLIIKNGE